MSSTRTPLPALIAVKVPPLGAHVLIFYYAVLSEVTPPTALAICGGTGLLMKGTVSEVVWSTATAVRAIVLVGVVSRRRR